MFLGGFSIAFYKGVAYTLICLAYVPVIVILFFFLGKNTRLAQSLKLEANQELGGFTEECLSAMKLVVSFSREDYILKKYNEKSKITMDIAKRASVLNALFFGLIRTFMFGFFVYTFWMATVLVQNKVENPNTGEPYNITEIVAITQSMIMAITQLLQIIPNLTNISKAQVVGKKVFDVIERKPKIRDTHTFESKDKYIVTLTEDIKFKNVRFRYPTTP